MKRIILAVLLSLTLACKEEVKESADLVLINGKVITVDENNPEAEAIAVRGDTIWAVGTTTEIEKLVGDNTKVIDLEGNVAYPGFIDSHSHFMGLGQSKMQLDLNKST